MSKPFMIPLLMFSSFFICCNANKKVSVFYSTRNCEQKSIEIELSELIASKSKYDNTPVEIIGYYYMSFEQSVLGIYPKGNRNNSENMIWVDFDPKLAKIQNGDTIPGFGSNEIKKLSGKKVKMKGIIEARQYAGLVARIKDVCYIEIIY